MAVPVMNVEILNYFRPVLSFIFIFVILFAILEKSKALGGDKHGLNGLVSFVVAFLVILTPGIIKLIEFMLGPFVVLFFFILFMVIIFLFMGVSSSDIGKFFSSSAMFSTMLVVSIIILIFAFSNVYGGAIQGLTAGEGGAAGLGNTVGKILFNPKVLGATFLLLIASQAMRLLTGSK